VERATELLSLGGTFREMACRPPDQRGRGCPYPPAIRENAWGLAHYARSAQESGLAPIIEPEILIMDGAHSIGRTA